MKSAFFVSVLFLSLPGLILNGQNSTSKSDKETQKEARKHERLAIEKALKAYTECNFDSQTKFKISDVARITKDKEETLARDTKTGQKGVSRTDSYRVMASFTDTPKDFLGRPYYFANVRPDRSKPSEYENDKKVLDEYLENMIGLGKGTISLKNPIEETYNGFVVHSVYRVELVGSNLGISIFFDDANKIATTIYFLSEPKDAKAISHFDTIDQWMGQREKFLNAFTKCVTENLK